MHTKVCIPEHNVAASRSKYGAGLKWATKANV